MRLTGILRSWNDDRGFGFITPKNGGAKIFVHISALPRDGSRPTSGERVSYELGRDKDGKPRAVNVQRDAISAARPRTHSRTPEPRQSRSPFGKLVGLILLIAVAAFGLNKYQNRPTAHPSEGMQMISTQPATEKAQTFQCDGRTHCSQMTSCTEAKFFSRSCPDTKMDGNNDGTPCEQQWCTSPFSK